ncbi:MAG TPA: molybdenum cofactor guanylyltransferase [Gammaproteobacteria bacterium]|nr:molybdenum cofactor guanylyltransferase [Gammaproteobacteria bacterium]
MGGVDKGLVLFHGRPLVAHVAAVLEPQVGRVVVSANREHGRYAALGYSVVADRWSDYRGPLAGLASALDIANTDYALVVPCDTPCLPADLLARLGEGLTANDAEVAVARAGGQVHHLCALMTRSLAGPLYQDVEAGFKKVVDWWSRCAVAFVDFPDPRAFVNLNTLEELASLESVQVPATSANQLA